jgi:hypothetical protein
MVLPGEDISVNLLERRSDSKGLDVFFEVGNASGGKAIKKGYARIKDAKGGYENS